MNTTLHTADEFREGMILEHWALDDTMIGKEIERTTRNGTSVVIEFQDGSRDEVAYYRAGYIRESTTDAQKDLILGLFTSKAGMQWRRRHSLLAIEYPHIPLGWVPLRWADAVRELVEEGRVGIRDFGDNGVYLVDQPMRSA